MKKAVLSIFVLSLAAVASGGAKPFALDRVRITGGVFKEKQDVDRQYLLEYLDIARTDKLLAEFRRVAGLPEKAKRYQGRWEGGGINGHTLGHYLTALAACYAATGDTRAKERVDYIVDELAACQEANGDGYVMTIPESAVWDKVRTGDFKAGAFDICSWWVPNYTIHKVFAGLRDAYRWTGSVKALEVERKLGDWYADMISGLTREQMERLMRSEWGGLNETFADLYVDTGDAKFLAIAKDRFDDRAIFDPLRRGEDRLDGKHANTQMPKITGLATIYELTGDESARKAVETYWNAVAYSRTLANGGHSDHEHFYPMKDQAKHLGPQTFETCNINNMHRLSAHLFAWQPSSKIADYVERSLINQLVANIGSKPGEFGYFMSTRPVACKVFSAPEGAWWCCVGTGMENPMRYGEQAYFHDGDGVWVNLYMASRLDWREKGVVLEQETDYPDGDKIVLRVKTPSPVRFALRLRKPGWCASPVLKLNSSTFQPTNGYFVIDREWRDGDAVELTLPMEWRTEALPGGGAEKYVAFMYGPKLMVGVNSPRSGVDDTAKRRWTDHLAAPAGVDEAAMAVVAPSVEAARHDMLKPRTLEFMPFHKVYEEHYTMYFRLFTPEEWRSDATGLKARAEREAARRALITDQVECGFQQSEVNHDYSGRGDGVGEKGGVKYRTAAEKGASFSYRLAVDPEAVMELAVSYLGAVSCDVFVDGKLVARESIASGGGKPRRRVYPLAKSMTKGKNSVEVKFCAFATEGPQFIAAADGGVSIVVMRKASSRAVWLLESEMTRNPVPCGIDKRKKPKWEYTDGLELQAALMVASRHPEIRKDALAWCRDYIERMVAKDGEIRGYNQSDCKLDCINPGKFAFDMYELAVRDGDEREAARLKKVLDTQFAQFAIQPRVAEGGFWHKKVYTRQMWLDGLYMGCPYYARYAAKFLDGKARAAAFDDIWLQFDVVTRHTFDPATGLYRHGWDEAKEQVWADKTTGQSAHAWGRALGWFAAAIVDTLEYTPRSHPAHAKLLALLQDYSARLVKWQDASGAWWQVADQPGRERNYLEATSTALIGYALMKGWRKGWLDADMRDAARRAYDALNRDFWREDADMTVSLERCCSVAGLGKDRDGSFAYYMREPIVDNDPKGVGPYMMLDLLMEEE